MDSWQILYSSKLCTKNNKAYGENRVGPNHWKLYNCGSRVLTETIISTLRDYFDNLGMQLTIAGIFSMKYSKCQKQLQLHVNTDLWAWSNADRSITELLWLFRWTSSKCNRPQAQLKAGGTAYWGRWPEYRGSLSIPFSWF